MRCITILFLLAALSTPLHNQAPHQRLHIMEDQFAARYPQWNMFTQQTKFELYNMFDQSPNKYAWFPDHYPRPEKGNATIRPRSTYFKLTRYE